jgi:CheY-like chemotaxis protein
VRVLVVDDDDSFRTFVKELLPRWVVVVGEARDGEEAIREAERLTPDLIFMDFQMPGLDGGTAAIAIHEFLPAARIVMLSGTATAEGAAAKASIPTVEKSRLDEHVLEELLAAA